MSGAERVFPSSLRSAAKPSAAKPSPDRPTRRPKQPRQLGAEFDSEAGKAAPSKTATPQRPRPRPIQTGRYWEEESRVLIGTPLTAAAVVYVIVLLVLLLCVIFAAMGTAWPRDLCLSVD